MTRRARTYGASHTPRGRSDDRGSGVVELPVMAVCFFAPLLALVIFAGRLHAGHTAVESAARHAARTISIARDPGAAAEWPSPTRPRRSGSALLGAWT